VRNQSTVPGQDGVWLGDTGHFRQLGTTSRLPISASVDLCGSESRKRRGR
jgi:hypothetical protein